MLPDNVGSHQRAGGVPRIASSDAAAAGTLSTTGSRLLHLTRKRSLEGCARHSAGYGQLDRTGGAGETGGRASKWTRCAGDIAPRAAQAATFCRDSGIF